MGAMTTGWTCPTCARRFTRKNQRHACGTGDREHVLRNRPRSVVELYTALEAFARSLGPVEFVARERYVLLRSTRIFTDVVIMSDRRQVSHVAKIRTPEELELVKPLIREAYEYSIS